MRITSPFQGWLLDEILVTPQLASIFCLRCQVDQKSVNRIPLVVLHAHARREEAHCGGFDDLIWLHPMRKVGQLHGGCALAQGFSAIYRWPLMRDDSSTWIDVKFKIEGALLLHLELRGYRSDRGATVQVNYVNDALVMGLEEVLFIPSCTVTP